MKKKILIIVFIVLIIIAAVFYFVLKNKKKTKINAESENIKLNNEYKYVVCEETRSRLTTDHEPETQRSQYYEIDTENNKVYYKEDYEPTPYFGTYIKEDIESMGFYTGKIIKEKDLSDEENKQLKELLDKVIYNGSEKTGKESENEKNETTSFYEFICYRVSNKDKKNCPMYNEDDQKLFNDLVN